MSTTGWAISPHTGRTYPATVGYSGLLSVHIEALGRAAMLDMPLAEAESYGWRWVPASDGAQEAADLARQDAHYRTHPRIEADS